MSSEEVLQYQARGYLGPYQALNAAEASQLAVRVSHDIVGPDQWPVGPLVHCRHLDSRLVYDLCTLPTVLDRVADILGPDLVLWRSNVWHKAPGAPAVAWHQDFNHWPLEPMINVSVWLALTEATIENGCVMVVPRSHREIRPLELAGQGDPFRETIVTAPSDETTAVPMELAPGQFFLFSEKLVHRSGVNTTSSPRTGVVSRLTTPAVRVNQDLLLDGRHSNILVRGVDRHGLNRLTAPPLGEGAQ